METKRPVESGGVKGFLASKANSSPEETKLSYPERLCMARFFPGTTFLTYSLFKDGQGPATSAASQPPLWKERAGGWGRIS